MKGIPMQDMVKLIRQLSYRHRTHKVFSDFVEMSAIALSNATDKAHFEPREDRYLEIVKNYNQEELNEFSNLLGLLVNHLEERPQDILGDVFHALELHNELKGQFFTPFPIGRMMSKMTIGKRHQDIINQFDFINVSEPACGTGAMIIAIAEELKEQGFNYQQSMHVTAVDLDITCVHAAFVQFSLLHIPAVVVHGNTITLEEFSHWYTPAHQLGFWNTKLSQKSKALNLQKIVSSADIGNAQQSDKSVNDSTHLNTDENIAPIALQLKLF
ncbi:N-6 DNA methylase [Emticicia fluvialis]|uniref:N-6 DNA methylase n=1 Tax=Emticicia fluvialis TaxID=2974474 RepID=UPI002166B771|nr:N-6 DNA methylase [Emticicia fluvialis]